MTGEQAEFSEFTAGSEISQKHTSVRLKNLAEVNPTKSELSDLDSDTDVSFIPLENFGTDGKIKKTETRQLGDVYDGYTYFQEGDVAIAKITPSFENGKGAICRGLKNNIGFGTTELHVLRPRPGVRPDYLWYILRSKRFMTEAKTAMRGVAGQQRVPTEFIENFRIETVSDRRQGDVVRYLDEELSKIDTLIEKKSDLKRNLLAKREAEISELITRGVQGEPELKGTDVEWFPQIPEGWDMVRLDYLRDQSQRICYGIVLPGPDQDSGIPIIQGGDCQSDKLTPGRLSKTTPEKAAEYERSKLEAGDLVYEIRGSVGRVVEVPPELEGANLSRDTARISPRQRVNTTWLKYALRSQPFRRQVEFHTHGAAVEGIKLADLRDSVLPVPPVNEQESIAEKAVNIDTIISDLEGYIDKLLHLLKEKRQALITAAVTGQIDVSEAQGES